MLDRRQHLGQGAFPGRPIAKACHAGHCRARGAVEAEGDAVEAGGAQGPGPFGAEQHAVAGEGDLGKAPGAQGLNGPDQLLKLGVQQGLAAGEPQAAGPQGHRCFDQPQSLRQRQ